MWMSEEKLESSFIEGDIVRALKEAAPLLNEPAKHLPPATFDREVEQAGGVQLDEKALRKWRNQKRSAYRREARRVLREGDEHAEAELRSRIQTLRELRRLMRQKRGQLQRAGFEEEMRQEAEWKQQVKIEKRLGRTLAKYEYHFEVLRAEKNNRRDTGGLPSESGRKRSFGSSTNWEHHRRAKLILDAYPGLSSQSVFFDKAAEIDWPDELGAASGETIWRGVQRLGKDATGEVYLPQQYLRFEGFKRLVRDLEEGVFDQPDERL